MAEKTATKEKKPAKKTPQKEAASKPAKAESPKKDGAFAVIATGGKQYKVAVGDVVEIEKLPGKKEGDKVSFNDVLLTDNGSKTEVGTPHVSGAKVEGVVISEERAKRLHVIRFRSKSRYFRKYGHRQPYMKVEITKI